MLLGVICTLYPKFKCINQKNTCTVHVYLLTVIKYMYLCAYFSDTWKFNKMNDCLKKFIFFHFP